MPLLLRLPTPLLRLLTPLLRPLRPRLLTLLPRLLTPLPLRPLTQLPLRPLTPLPLRLLKARRSNRLPAQVGRKGPPHGGPFFLIFRPTGIAMFCGTQKRPRRSGAWNGAEIPRAQAGLTPAACMPLAPCWTS